MANLKKMRYGKFTWTNNPAECNFECDRAFVVHKYPGFHYADIEDFGTNTITLTGSGEFFGKNAYKTWKKLESVFNEGKVHSFYHPVYTAMKYALMTKLTSGLVPRENYVSYTFEVVISDSVKDSKPVILVNSVNDKKPSTTQSRSSGGSSQGTKNDTGLSVGDVVLVVIDGTSYDSPSGKKAVGSFSHSGVKYTITDTSPGSKCPIHIGNQSYGWIDDKYVKKINSDNNSTNKTVVYVIRKGDVLSSICLKYGIKDWKSVASYNGIKNANNISVGQKIKININK